MTAERLLQLHFNDSRAFFSSSAPDSRALVAQKSPTLSPPLSNSERRVPKPETKLEAGGQDNAA